MRNIIFRLLVISMVLTLVFKASSVFAIETAVVETLLKGNWQEVFAMIEKDDKMAKDPVARLIMAHACLATNRNNASIMLFLSVKDENDLKAWSEWTDSLATKHPKNPIALYLSGDAKARIGKLKEAEEIFTKAIEIKNDFALAYNARGVVRTLKNELDGAVTDLNWATQFDPNLADAHANLGAYHILKESAEGALKAFNKALKINPEFALAYNGIGCAYFGKGEFEKANQAFSIASQLSPILVVAEVNQGFAFAYASQMITLASIERKPGTTLKSLIQQYPNILKEQQEKYINMLSPQKELLNTDFAFKQPNKLSSLVEKYGLGKVKIAMSYDLERFKSRMADYTIQIQKKITTPELKSAKSIITLDMVNKLTTTGYSAYRQLTPRMKGWSPYIKPFRHQIKDTGLYSDLPTSQELNQLGRDLKASGIRDLIKWAIKTVISPILPSWVKNIHEGYEIGYDITSFAIEGPGKTPAKVLDLKPIATLGGLAVPMTGVLIPVTKWCYGMALEALGSIDIRSQMASLDEPHRPFTPVKTQLPSRIPGYYISTDSPLTDIGALASKVAKEIKPIHGSMRRAVIVSQDAFRTSLLQSELHKYGIQTRIISPRADVQTETKRWGANVQLGIKQIDDPSKKYYDDIWRRIPPPPFPPGGGAAVPRWDWGKPFIPTSPKDPEDSGGGVVTEQLAKAFVDKGNWPVLTSFSLFYKVSPFQEKQSEGREQK